jgi:hypothetical protein
LLLPDDRLRRALGVRPSAELGRSPRSNAQSSRSRHCLRKGREASNFRGATFFRRCLSEATSVGVATPSAITGASGSGYSGIRAQCLPQFTRRLGRGFRQSLAVASQHRRLSGSRGLPTCLRHCLGNYLQTGLYHSHCGVSTQLSAAHGSLAPWCQRCVRAYPTPIAHPHAPLTDGPKARPPCGRGGSFGKTGLLKFNLTGESYIGHSCHYRKLTRSVRSPSRNSSPLFSAWGE